MPANSIKIPLTLIYQGVNYPLCTYPDAYYSLMTLISDQLPVTVFGLCNGMGSCGTCIVEISSQYSLISRPVLACAIQINDELSNTQITIPGQRY